MLMPQISNMWSVRGFATQRCLGGVAAQCVKGINNLLPFQDLPIISENKTYTASDTLYIAGICRYIWRHITANIHAPPRVDIEVIFNFEHADQLTYFCH